MSDDVLGPVWWHKAPLVLCATIHVNEGIADAALTDPLQRTRDYLNCLQFYLEQSVVTSVVFVENSGADLSPFRTLSKTDKPVECVALQTNAFPGAFGKGYGEALMLDAALRQSALLAKAPAFMKATGRIYLRNIDAIVRSTPAQVAGVFDVRDHQLYRLVGSRSSACYSDTRFYAVRRSLFDAHFRLMHATHTVGAFSLEAHYLRAIRTAQSSGWRIADRFRREPRYGGKAGHGGKDYDGLQERGKRLVRGLTRRLLPELKI